jgi:hypothetical protein
MKGTYMKPRFLGAITALFLFLAYLHALSPFNKTPQKFLVSLGLFNAPRNAIITVQTAIAIVQKLISPFDKISNCAKIVVKTTPHTTGLCNFVFNLITA